MPRYGLTRDLLDDLRTQPGRTALASLSVAAGSAVLAVALAVNAGLREHARRAVAQLGVHVFGLVADTPAAGATPLLRRHADLLAANLDGCRATALRVYPATGASLPTGTSVVAADADLLRVRPWRLAAGRPLDAADVRAGDRVAVISAALARRADLRVGDAAGPAGLSFRVVGIVEVDGAAGAAAAGDLLIFVPWTVPPAWLRDAARPGDTVDAVYVKVSDPDRFPAALRAARGLMRQPGGAPAASWVTPEGLMRQLARLRHAVTLAGGALAALCLLLGGTSLTSLQLAAVQQRIPEIGLRMALGASRVEVGLLFLAESVVLTTAAAVAGTLVACAAAALAAGRLPLPLAVDAWTIALPVLSGVLLGAASSFWPARHAAGIAPADALRNG